jgi:ATP-dependent 26S proteasome regulatory subunit
MAASFVDELSLHLKAGYPLVFVQTQEEQRALTLIETAVSETGGKLVRARAPGAGIDLAQQIPETKKGDVLLLDSVHRQLDDPAALRLLADLAAAQAGGGAQAIALAPWIELPPELERLSAVLELPLPTPDELRGVLDRVCAKEGVLQTGEDASALVRVAQGLTEEEAVRAFRKAMIGWPEDALAAAASVSADKRLALRRSRVLEHVDTPTNLDDVGGLDQLKNWLDSRRDAFSERAREYGLPAPRGLLLMGIQGCGKSLTSKAVAGFWRLPLIRLDLSAVFGAPRPEEALRSALRVAEAMAPLVLWIDEVEKGFDQGGEGPAARLLGGMVTWLQEKQKEVFVVATANRVAALPPELPRKGRFDEIFFVDLPNVHERREILALHLQKRGRDPAAFQVENLARAADQLTGSELEQLVIAAMYSSFSRGEELTDDDLTYALKETVPLAETFEEEIKALREWARKRARPASTDRRKADYFSGKDK